MSRPLPPLTSKQIQTGIISLAVAGLAIGGYETGRRSVDPAAITKNVVTVPAPPAADVISPKQTFFERDHSRITVPEIATVPFSELYDVLKSAPREQLLAWARDLEQMPRGPRQRAAVAAYYKSLVQVDHHAAIEAVLHVKNLPMRDVALNAVIKAAPESIWSDLAQMTEQLPYGGRSYDGEDVIENWSRVDPLAASQFLERHSRRVDQQQPDDTDPRVVCLLANWGEIDPAAARRWLEADASRQTGDAVRALVTSWGRVDSAAAIDYAVANESNPQFKGAINELVYQFVRSAKEDATKLILLLRPDSAKRALENVVDTIILPEVFDPNFERPPDYQRPPEEVAQWIGSLPLELWPESIGKLTEGWLDQDAGSAIAWLDQLPSEKRENAIVSFCRAANAGHVEHVLTLSSKLSDRRLRDRVVGEFATRLGTEGQSAGEAIDRMEISDVDKAYLRKLSAEGENGR